MTKTTFLLSLFILSLVFVASCGSDEENLPNSDDTGNNPTNDGDPSGDDYAAQVGSISITGEIRFRYGNFIAGVDVYLSDDTGQNTIVLTTDENGDFELVISEDDVRAAGFDADTRIDIDKIMIGSAELELSPNESKDSDTPDSFGDYDFLTVSLNNYAEGEFYGSVETASGDVVEGATVEFDQDDAYLPPLITDASGDFYIKLDAESMALAQITFDASEKEVCADASLGDLVSTNDPCKSGVDGEWDFGTIVID